MAGTSLCHDPIAKSNLDAQQRPCKIEGEIANKIGAPLVGAARAARELETRSAPCVNFASAGTKGSRSTNVRDVRARIMDAPPPASLKHIKKFLDEAKARQAQDPLVAYHLRLYALQEAMEVRAKIPKEDMAYILVLMDAAEAEKKALGATAEQGEADKHAHVENFALELFEKADDADRKGQSNLATAKVFNSAYHVMEACKQFGGELPEDMLEKIKYAKWRVVEIAKATKERRAPAPPRGLEQPEAAEEGSDGQGMHGGEGGSDGAAQPPPPPDAAPPVGGPAVPPPPPDYMGLPPPPGVVPPAVYAGDQASFDSSVLPGAPSSLPPAYPGGSPPSMPPPVPLGVPTGPGYPGGPAAHCAPPMSPLPTSYTPGKPQMFEAHKLCQSAQAGTTRTHPRVRKHVHMPTQMHANAPHSRPCLGQAMHSCSIAWA